MQTTLRWRRQLMFWTDDLCMSSPAASMRLQRWLTSFQSLGRRLPGRGSNANPSWDCSWTVRWLSLWSGWCWRWCWVAALDILGTSLGCYQPALDGNLGRHPSSCSLWVSQRKLRQSCVCIGCCSTMSSLGPWRIQKRHQPWSSPRNVAGRYGWAWSWLSSTPCSVVAQGPWAEWCRIPWTPLQSSFKWWIISGHWSTCGSRMISINWRSLHGKYKLKIWAISTRDMKWQKHTSWAGQLLPRMCQAPVKPEGLPWRKQSHLSWRTMWSTLTFWEFLMMSWEMSDTQLQCL